MTAHSVGGGPASDHHALTTPPAGAPASKSSTLCHEFLAASLARAAAAARIARDTGRLEDARASSWCVRSDEF